MGILLSMGVCPFCNGGHNTACYATYDNGYKCYSCGASKSYSKEQQGFVGLPTVLKPKMSEIVLPDFVSDPRLFNLGLKQWLYKYYLDDKLIRKYNIYAADNSLLFLSHQDGEVKFYQQRFFPNKYIKSSGKKHSMRFTNGHKTVVLTEDYISAIRVHECNVDSWCIFGTSIGWHELTHIIDQYNKIIIWLDGDEAGIKGCKKVKQDIEKRIKYVKNKFPYKYTQEYIIEVLQTPKDPKEYSPSEIEEILYSSN